MRFRLIVLLLVTAISLAACSGIGNKQTTETDTNNTTTEYAPTTEAYVPTTEARAVDQLNSRQKGVFDAVIKMTKADFYNPSKIRILEIGDSENVSLARAGEDYTKAKVLLYIVVRLQGENRAGGTLNHYYKIVYGEAELPNLGRVSGSDRLGEYKELPDAYKISEELSSSSEWDLAPINKAIKEYWQELGID